MDPILASQSKTKGKIRQTIYMSIPSLPEKFRKSLRQQNNNHRKLHRLSVHLKKKKMGENRIDHEELVDSQYTTWESVHS
jgi:hypothetical protein